MKELPPVDQPALSPYAHLHTLPNKPIEQTPAEAVAALSGTAGAAGGGLPGRGLASKAAQDHREELHLKQAAARISARTALEAARVRLANLENAPNASKEALQAEREEVRVLSLFPNYVPGMTYNVAKRQMWLPFAMDRDSDYWKPHNARMKERAIAKGLLSREDFETKYAPAAFEPPPIAHIHRPMEARVFNKMYKILENQILSTSSDMKFRNMFCHGPPGGGKTFGITRYDNQTECTHRLASDVRGSQLSDGAILINNCRSHLSCVCMRCVVAVWPHTRTSTSFAGMQPTYAIRTGARQRPTSANSGGLWLATLPASSWWTRLTICLATCRRAEASRKWATWTARSLHPCRS